MKWSLPNAPDCDGLDESSAKENHLYDESDATNKKWKLQWSMQKNQHSIGLRELKDEKERLMKANAPMLPLLKLRFQAEEY